MYGVIVVETHEYALIQIDQGNSGRRTTYHTWAREAFSEGVAPAFLFLGRGDYDSKILILKSMTSQIFSPTETVSFTGYRPDKIQKSQPGNNFLFAEIQAHILVTIHKLAERGYKTFLSGMAEGFDLMAASAVLLARNTYPNIRLVCVVPFPEQADKFAPFWKSEHARILEQSQRQIIISDHFYSRVFHKRNDFLVNNASLLVCYYDGQSGGTQYTVESATGKKLEIINLFGM